MFAVENQSFSVRALLLLCFAMLRKPGQIILLLVLFFVIRLGAEALNLYHFQPYVAFMFCLPALGLTRWIPGVLFLYLATTFFSAGEIGWWILSPFFAFALVAAWGHLFQGHRQFGRLLAGSVAGAILFFVMTNLMSWTTTGRYALDATGFWQALWLGLPTDSVPTWAFLRNSAISTVLYSAIILLFARIPFTSPQRVAVEA